MNRNFQGFLIVATVLTVLLGTVQLSSGQTNGHAPSFKSKPISLKSLKQSDIGKSTKTGSSEITGSELKVVAGGADIWGKRDEFRFSYKQLKGDFDISVQILGLGAAHAYTKAGIMAREDLSDDSPHVYYQVFPDNRARNKNNGGCEFQYRALKTGDMKAIYPADAVDKTECKVDFPNTYIRMKRHGDNFESFFSNDNKNWIHYSSFTLKMTNELFVGLAVTSHNSADYTTARFTSLQHWK
jgi:hypothetical protein